MQKRSIYIASLFIVLFSVAYFVLPTAVDLILASSHEFIKGKQLTESVKFFLTHVPTLLILLSVAVFVISILRSYVSRKKSLKLLATKSLFKGNVIASFVGIIMPFCSCGVVPMFLGLVQAGVPLGVSLSLLIAAPMINEIALILLFGLFGWQTALLYVSTGLIIAITSGYIIGRLGIERYVEDWVKSIGELNVELTESKNELTFTQRIDLAFVEVKTTVSKIWLFIILGMGVGSVLYGYVPDSFMIGMMGKTQWWSVPLAVLVGIPLYMNSAGIIPIVQVLLSKGAALGTSLAFMMSVIGLSLPEILILRRVLKLPLILIFVGIIAMGITIVGFLFNLIY